MRYSPQRARASFNVRGSMKQDLFTAFGERVLDRTLEVSVEATYPI
jgi:hypothetical protein